MYRRILLALLFVALIAMPAAASVQNVKVSGSLDSTWLIRNDFDFGNEPGNVSAGVAGTADNSSTYRQNLIITQATLRVDADLTDNVSTVIQLLHERPWGEPTDVNNDIDINLAYVQLREMLYSPLTVYIGRQQLNYGNGLIIGTGGPNNSISYGGLNSVAEDLTKARAYDAVRAVLDYDPLTVDLIYSKVDDNTNGGTEISPRDDVNLYGANANWKLGDSRNSAFEGYFFAKIDDSVRPGAATSPGHAKVDTVYTPGLRASTNPIDGMMLSGEIAWQFGTKTMATGSTAADNLRRDAMAVQVIGSYALPFEDTKKWSPVVFGAYTHLTGDQNPTDTRELGGAMASRNKWTGWDPMFENQSGGTIYNTLFNYTNAHIGTAGLSLKPMEDVTTKVTWTGLWMDQELNNAVSGGTARDIQLIQPDGTTQIVQGKLGETQLGNEIDTDLVYNYTEDVQIGLSAGWFIPGDVFSSLNENTASQFITHANVNF